MSDSIQDNSQAERFLIRLQAMNPESRAAFERIMSWRQKSIHAWAQPSLARMCGWP